jgi:hypothetical protein
MTSRRAAPLGFCALLLAAAHVRVSAQIEARLAPVESFAARPAAPAASAASVAGLTAAPALACATPPFAAAAAPLPAAAAPAEARAAAPAVAAPARASASAILFAAGRAAAPALAAAAMDGSRAKRADEPAAAPVDLRRMELLELRPTQMSVGLREVDEKVAKLRGKDVDDYLRARPVPVVLGPSGRTYLVDHHHLVRAAWEAGLSHVHVEVKADLSGLSEDAFWVRMKAENWVYPYDQFGGGPHDPRNLPETVRGLADDPYRSVAGEVRERGGYEKNDAPFSEFLWAQFFRERLKTHPTYHDFESAVAEAMKLAKTEAAERLPGWSGGR